MRELIKKIYQKLWFPHSYVDRSFRKIYYKFFPAKSYLNKILYGCVPRPWYGYCLYEAASSAVKLGYSKMSVIELGMAGGDGLINMEKHVENIERELNIQIEVYGFGLQEGLPPSKDYRDCLFYWQQGSYQTDCTKLQTRLKRSKLVLGNVKQTCKTFFEDYNPAPIGCAMFDLDYYTSTRDALQLFAREATRYLPRVYCYFDDVTFTNEYLGELCAVKEFNEAHDDRKIAPMYNLGEILFTSWHSWLTFGRRIFQFHCFYHPSYNQSLYGDMQIPLPD